jgi:glucoamylase
VAQFKKAGSIEVDQYSVSFFKDIYPEAEERTYRGDALRKITSAMTSYADGFVSAVEMYLPQNGSISEQFNRTTGESLSASKLTWSFAAFVTMARRRAGDYPPSWGAASALANTNLTSEQCNGTSWNSTGNYTPARAAGAPGVDKSCKSEIIFTVNATTQFGQNVYILGNTTDLGNSFYNESAIILPLNPGNYTSVTPE